MLLHLIKHVLHTDYCDHFETPLRAYEDVAEVLSLLAKRLGKTPATLRLWDPYFCEGRTVRHLATLGFTSVHHENKGTTLLTAYSLLEVAAVMHSAVHRQGVVAMCQQL
jgi:hypothetical protein